MWFIVGSILMLTLIYQRASINIFTLAVAVLLLLYSGLHHAHVAQLITLWGIFFLLFLPMRIRSLRYAILTKPALKIYRSVMPSMSRTEREALAAGTVSFEGEIFCGNPNWQKLLAMPKGELSAEEKAFIDGPVNQLCSMIDDWDIMHRRADLPPEIWEFLKHEGFFSLIIPKEYGGKDFSACAQSQILTRIYGKSPSVATTVGVPNSLGPGELLHHYGTEEQKKYYLPRLARGEEIPCFALTGPESGSDAGSMTDIGVICHGEFEGQNILGIRLNFNKRYITLAPVATVIGLAFRLLDPEHLLGSEEDLGITCALIPRNTTGVEIGRRHFPVGAVFQNGPIKGKDVFIPLDWIIGGIKMAGHGWRMLMECLATGRAISLPAASLGGAKSVAHASGAYARVRRQFNASLAQFEGIQDVLARIAGLTWIMNATRWFTASLIDQGAKPAVASAITKYHVTEMGRIVGNDAMDLHGGKGVCLGPNNYLGRAYQSIPIAITVEGANILTRSLIIFGQGAMRCHPYLFREFEAAQEDNPAVRLREFDRALIGHMGYTLSNIVRTFLLSLTSGRLARVPRGKTKRYFQQITRFSAALALVSDISLLILGGALKRRESISGRLGDILSYLYMLSAVLKKYHDDDRNSDDYPVVQWAAQTCFYEVQQRFDALFKNYPTKWMAALLRVIVFPYGKHFSPPNDHLCHRLADLSTDATPFREHLIDNVYLNEKDSHDSNTLLEKALHQMIAAEPLKKILRKAERDGVIQGDTFEQKARAGVEKNIISQAQFDSLLQAEKLFQKVIAVDDFASQELQHG
ncbi:MAG: acyl-CoA dehydrogenase [Gammaproteobacteria bacterium]|nr:acyl-CoA dehydrogenase [Gammaproteobacteria bacterium]